MHTVLKLAQLRLTMLYECLMSDFQRKFSMENLQEGKRSQDCQKKRYKTYTLKAFLKNFDIPIGVAGSHQQRSNSL